MNFFEKVLNLVYPPVCGICEEICNENLCKNCEKELNKLMKVKIIPNYNEKIYFDKHLYIFDYNGIIREKIIDYKFNNKSYIYKTFSKIIIKNKKICRFLEKYDIIIPVPIHKNRKNKRGYNQSELIAIEIAKEITNLTINTISLYKQKNAIPQSKLNKFERAYNIDGVYNIKKIELIKDKKIIILDDVYTTGSTVNECSKILKNAGASKIGVLTLAKD